MASTTVDTTVDRLPGVMEDKKAATRSKIFIAEAGSVTSVSDLDSAAAAARQSALQEAGGAATTVGADEERWGALQALFDSMDKNRDGTVDRREVPRSCPVCTWCCWDRY